MLPCTANARIEPLARVCAIGPGCKQTENRNKENPNRRREFQGNRRYNSTLSLLSVCISILPAFVLGCIFYCLGIPFVCLGFPCFCSQLACTRDQLRIPGQAAQRAHLPCKEASDKYIHSFLKLNNLYTVSTDCSLALSIFHQDLFSSLIHAADV